jgi:hypothetical protein
MTVMEFERSLIKFFGNRHKMCFDVAFTDCNSVNGKTIALDIHSHRVTFYSYDLYRSDHYMFSFCDVFHFSNIDHRKVSKNNLEFVMSELVKHNLRMVDLSYEETKKQKHVLQYSKQLLKIS